MEIFDPSSGGKPVMGQPVVYRVPTGGSPGYNIIIEPWSGTYKQGAQPLSQAQGLQALQSAAAEVKAKYTSGPGYSAPADKNGMIAVWEKMVSEFSTRSGQFAPTEQETYLSTNFNPNASTPSIENFSAAGKAAYISPEQGLADAQAKTPVTTGATSQNTAIAGGALMPPTVNLQPGDTGAEVKKLQDYLVSKGLMTQAQVDTGYGTYGPQTTSAVAALQKSLGVDNSTGVGYFGPRTISALGTQSGSSGGATGGATPSGGTVDPELLSILNNPLLAPDQRAVIQGIFNAVSSNDADTASRIQAAMKAASEFSDPYFKAQIRLATDALQRGISGKEGDLAFAESQQRAALDELRANTASSKDYLSLEHAQELKGLETKYQTDLQTTQDNLAATGFTSSSKRARSEQILGEQNTGLVESSNKQFAYQTGNLDRALTATDASTQAQIANLQRLASEGKLDLLRSAEESVGSSNLPNVSGLSPLGGVGGSIPRAQATDALSFASSFVF